MAARKKTRRVPGISSTIRMSASAFSITSTAKGKSVTLDLPALPERGRSDFVRGQLSEVSRTVCELHGIREPQLRVNGKFVKRQEPEMIAERATRPKRRARRHQHHHGHSAGMQVVA